MYICIYTFKGNFLRFSYHPLPLFLSLDTVDRCGSTFPPFHHVFVTLIKSLWASSSAGWAHTPPPLLTQLMLQFLSVHLLASLQQACIPPVMGNLDTAPTHASLVTLTVALQWHQPASAAFEGACYQVSWAYIQFLFPSLVLLHCKEDSSMNQNFWAWGLWFWPALQP